MKTKIIIIAAIFIVSLALIGTGYAAINEIRGTTTINDALVVENDVDQPEEQEYPIVLEAQPDNIAWTNLVHQIDEQGAITVEALPLNLNEAENQIQFEIALNTHSVDLSMDLAQLASLTTDNGLTLAATSWDAPNGGHHLTGTLIFEITSEEADLLKSSYKLMLTINNLDVEVRNFTWHK